MNTPTKKWCYPLNHILMRFKTLRCNSTNPSAHGCELVINQLKRPTQSSHICTIFLNQETSPSITYLNVSLKVQDKYSTSKVVGLSLHMKRCASYPHKWEKKEIELTFLVVHNIVNLWQFVENNTFLSTSTTTNILYAYLLMYHLRIILTVVRSRTA